MSGVGFHLLVKPSGSACNLACDYCFFLRKSALYPGQHQRMSRDALDAYLEQLFRAHPSGEVNVAFQGGEPTLMGLDFFADAVALADRHRRPGQVASYSIQTNATLIDDEWAAFLAEIGFLVGVSVDGPDEVHDAYRRTGNGEPTHALVMQAIGRLNAADVQWNALTAVSRASEGRGRDVYEFLRDKAGARFIQFIPIVERTTDEAGTAVGSDVTDHSVSPQEYGRFLNDVFDAWVRRDVGDVYVQDFDVALAAWANEGFPLCTHAPTCGRALALEFNGDLYSCDHFVDPANLLGNIGDSQLSELVESDAQHAFGQRKLEAMPEACADCHVRFACNGGCPKDRFVPTGGGGPDANYLCEGYQMFYRHIASPMTAMAGLLASNRAPSEIMGMMAAADSQREAAFRAAGRNEACPCGSGRKYKHCHGRGR